MTPVCRIVNPDAEVAEVEEEEPTLPPPVVEKTRRERWGRVMHSHWNPAEASIVGLLLVFPPLLVQSYAAAANG